MTTERAPSANWREPTKTPERFGFEWGESLQVQRVCSTPNGYHVLALFTPAGRVELTISPRGSVIHWRRFDKSGKRSRGGRL